MSTSSEPLSAPGVGRGAAQPPDLAAVEPRVLDAVLALALMGFRRVEQPPDYDGKHGGEAVLLQPGNFPGEPDNGWQWPPKGRVAFDAFVPSYSTDPAAALEVVEAMKDHERAGHTYHLAALGAWHGWSFAFYAGFHAPEDTDMEAWSQAKTFERGVCLAALRTLHANGLLPPEALALLS